VVVMRAIATILVELTPWYVILWTERNLGRGSSSYILAGVLVIGDYMGLL